MKQSRNTYRMPGAGLLLAVAVGAALTACGGSSDDKTLVATDKGEVRGTETAGMREFLGIPYAAPPTGALRWKPPAEAASWSQTRDATSYATSCPQVGGPFGTASTNEDCLYLNVFTPKGDGPFPVMVWIHGGAFVSGGASAYDPSKLVNQGVAVVTINYRLGALGFLAHPALTAEQGSSGNYGLLDQQAALRWVKQNIASFGGDPANVTIFGESAGGYSVHSQLASPLANGLFSKAIIQSGAYSLDQAPLSTAEGGGTAFANAAGCSGQDLSCLRSLPVEKVLATSGAVVAPVIDNKVLTMTVRNAYTTGNYNKVPTIEGNNAEEYSLLSAVTMDLVPSVGPVTADNYQARLTGLLAATRSGRSFSQVDAEYPLANYAGPAQAYDAVATDLLLACSGRTAIRLRTASNTSVYAYEFNDPNAPMLYLPPATRSDWGAYHAAEIQYLFPTSRTDVTYTAAQQALSDQMVSYWTQFAKSANPNGTGPTWPQYAIPADTYMSLEPGTSRTTGDFASRHHCGFWTGT